MAIKLSGAESLMQFKDVNLELFSNSEAKPVGQFWQKISLGTFM